MKPAPVPPPDDDPGVVAFRQVLAEVEAIHGLPRIRVTDPTRIRGDGGTFWRLSAVWFLPVDGFLTNHGFRVDVYEGRHTTVAAWNHRGVVSSADLTIRDPDAELIRVALRLVGLLSPG